MRAVLPRSGSGPVTTSLVICPTRGLSPDQDSGSGISFPVKYHAVSPKSALHFEIKDGDRCRSSNGNLSGLSTNFRRAKSETDLNLRPIVNSGGLSSTLSLNCFAYHSFPVRILEEDFTEGFGLQRNLEKGDEKDMIVGKEEDVGSLNFGRKLVNLGVAECSAGIVTEEQVLQEELGFSGGGTGKGRKIGGGRGGGGGGGGSESFAGGSADQNNIGVYYQEMLKANPGNSLLLRNYGRFLHEFEKDTVKAEEYYGRAILASPGDGEVLSLYAKLIWETQGDEERAEGYFDRAIEAAPGDCYVLGSYAHFLWDAEDDDETVAGSSSLVEAF